MDVDVVEVVKDAVAVEVDWIEEALEVVAGIHWEYPSSLYQPRLP